VENNAKNRKAQPTLSPAIIKPEGYALSYTSDGRSRAGGEIRHGREEMGKNKTRILNCQRASIWACMNSLPTLMNSFMPPRGGEVSSTEEFQVGRREKRAHLSPTFPP